MDQPHYKFIEFIKPRGYQIPKFDMPKGLVLNFLKYPSNLHLFLSNLIFDIMPSIYLKRSREILLLDRFCICLTFNNDTEKAIFIV